MCFQIYFVNEHSPNAVFNLNFHANRVNFLLLSIVGCNCMSFMRVAALFIWGVIDAEHYVKNGDVKIWTEISGTKNGSYIILCNGGPGDCDYLLPISQMVDDGFAVIRFEPRGCGRSEKDGKYDIATTISDLEAIREYYKINTWSICGHSFGAIIALFYVIAYPDRVISFIDIAGGGLQYSDKWLADYHVKLKKHGEARPEMLYQMNSDVNQAGFLSFLSYVQSPCLYKVISELKIPSLFICAENDIRPNWPTEQIQALIGNSKLVSIPGAAHYIWLTHYNELKLELRKFLGLCFS